MKRVLITGVNSYIGTNFSDFIDKFFSKDIFIQKISVRDESWKEMDFSIFDSVLHVSGIAHMDEKTIGSRIYFEVNRDLTISIARKAKSQGVNQFIFLSSMSVYGKKSGKIDRNTVPNPLSNYGRSKLEAENILNSLADENFTVAIVRPPMVYGFNSIGNYQRLKKLMKFTRFFVDSGNERSMIYIENLSEFLRLLIEDKSGGVFCPQNKEFVNTSQMVVQIFKEHSIKLFVPTIKFTFLKKINISILQKLFGDLVYDKDISTYTQDYALVDFKESISRSEKFE